MEIRLRNQGKLVREKDAWQGKRGSASSKQSIKGIANKPETRSSQGNFYYE